MSASSGSGCRICGGGGGMDAACPHHTGGARCADLNRAFTVFPGEPAPVGAVSAGLHEFQFFGHDVDHESVAWLFNDSAAPAAGGAEHLHRHTPGVGATAEHAPQTFDAYGQYNPGHGLTFDVALSRGEAAGVEAGRQGLGGGDAIESGASIVSDFILWKHIHRRRHDLSAEGASPQCRGKPKPAICWRPGNGARGEGDEVQGEEEKKALREANPVRFPEGLC